MVAICYVLDMRWSRCYFVISLFRATRRSTTRRGTIHATHAPIAVHRAYRRCIIADFRFGLGVSLLLSGGVLAHWLSIIPIVLRDS